MKIITCIAPVNIAVIKYWGKRDEELILPLNDSISCTFSTDHLFTKTTIIASPQFKENKLWLNGKEESFDNKRLDHCLKAVKKRANPEQREILQWNLHICSENNFPTAAGLASSAAGYACLVYGLSVLFNVEGDISDLARRGSGSACRSILGGWVHWHKGEKSDGSDSIATQIVPASYWSDIRVLVLVATEQSKKDSSKDGMKRSVATSELLKYRAENVVPKRVKAIRQAIIDRDFHTFAKITMQESNTFHATCLDTYPPCIYMSDISHAIIEMVHAFNDFHGVNRAAYTFDAGQNGSIFVQEKDVEDLLAIINYVFPMKTTEHVEYLKGIPVNVKVIPQLIANAMSLRQVAPGSLLYIIHTKAGEGPKIIDDESSHLLTADGLPKKLIQNR